MACLGREGRENKTRHRDRDRFFLPFLPSHAHHPTTTLASHTCLLLCPLTLHAFPTHTHHTPPHYSQHLFGMKTQNFTLPHGALGGTHFAQRCAHNIFPAYLLLDCVVVVLTDRFGPPILVFTTSSLFASYVCLRGT